METLSTSKESQTLNRRQFVAGEVNLARLPFFASSTKGLKKKIGIEYRHVAEIGGRQVDVLWEVTANAKYGYPGPFAEAVHTTVMKIVTEKGFPFENPFVFTFYDISKRLDLVPSGKTYKEIRDALKSIRFAGIEIRQSFITKDGRRPMYTDTQNLYRRVVFFGDKDPHTAEPIEHSAVWFADFYLNSLNSGYFRPIDFEYYKLIRKASFASPKLYNHLGYCFSGSCFKHNNEYARVDYDTLAILADVKRYRYLSDAKRSLSAGHQILVQTEFLDREPVWKVEKQGKGKPDKFYILYYPGNRAREEYRKGRRYLTKQLEIPFEESGRGETPSPKIANELIALGVTESRAVRLSKQYTATQINLQLDHLAYLGEIGRPIKDNTGGWIADAIEKEYTPPKGFKTRTERETERKAKTEIEAQQKQKEDAEREHNQKQEIRYKELDERLTSLPTDEQHRISEEIETRIRNGFDAFMRNRYITKPFDPKSAIHRGDYYRHLTELLK